MKTIPHACRGGWREASGYSLIELMVAMLVSALVVGGVMTMLVSIEEVQRDSQQVIDAQQQARISLEQMQRDLQQAGVGLAWLVAPLPLVVPTGATSFEIRHNQGGVSSPLVADQPGTGGVLTVADVTGFAVGQTAGVYDATGAFDLVTITNIDAINARIAHSGTTKAFTVADGTAVAHIETIRYALDVNGFLTRQVDNGTVQPLAGNVTNFAITYWDNSDPSVVFVPATNAQMMRIQTVQVDLTLETEDVQINTLNTRQVTLTTRVTPRAIVLS